MNRSILSAVIGPLPSGTNLGITTKIRFSLVLFLVLSVVMSAASASAGTIVYDNTINNTFSTGLLSGNELADDLHMTSGGNMTAFQFGVIANGSTQATVRFYTNDATDSIWPGNGSVLLHTEVVAIAAAEFGLKTVNLAAAVAVPKDLWMSVQFNGISGSVRLFDPPVVGTSHNDVVIFGVNLGADPRDPFGNGRSSIQASVEIPEPSALAFALIGLLAHGRRRR